MASYVFAVNAICDVGKLKCVVEGECVGMNKNLSMDECDALEQISRLSKKTQLTACVNRNAKRLCGLKFARYRKDGLLELTEEGKSLLFSRQCIDGLRLVMQDPAAQLMPQVLSFLSKKSYINSSNDGLHISQRGMECLADIDAQKK